MADTDGEQGGAQLRPQHRGDGGETEEGMILQQRLTTVMLGHVRLEPTF